MNHWMRMSVLMGVAGLSLLLAGCGSARSGHKDYASTVRAYAPSQGVFARLDAASPSQEASVSSACNLDSIDGAAVGSHPVSRDIAVLFSGWAAGGKGVGVPHTVEIVLQGAQAFGVRALTGQVRLDVAAASRNTKLMQSGFQVRAVMAVPAGTYHTELRYQVAGNAWICKPTSVLSVE